MDKHDREARKVADEIAYDILEWYEVADYDFQRVKARLTTALRDISRDAKREVLRDLSEPSEAVLGELFGPAQMGKHHPARLVCFRAMLKQFASENGIDLEEVEG